MDYKEMYDKLLPEAKRREEKFNIMVSAIIRPLSILMTLPLVNTKVKPTTITKISIVFSTVGFGLLAFGPNIWLKILGFVSIFVWTLLDGVDGNLARCTNQCSANGDLWDTMGGYAAMVYIYFGAGIAAFYEKSLFVFCDEHWMIILGGATAVMSIFPRLVMHKKKSSCGNTEAVKTLSDKKSFGLKNIIVMNFISPTGFMLVFLAVAIVFNMLNLFISMYFLINFAVMILSLRPLLKE